MLPRGFTTAVATSSFTGPLPTVQYIFAYGTLRDDDTSGVPWTVPFFADPYQALSGRVHGFVLFQSSGVNYPFACQTGRTEDVLHGRLISWEGEAMFRRKLLQADEIEGYNEKDPNYGEYRRTIIEVSVDVDTDSDHGTVAIKTVPAYIYFQDAPLKARRIDSGDWLQR